MGPDVETAFEWPDPVEANHRGRQGNVEDEHGGDPGQSLRAAETRGDPHPGTPNDAEDLRENQVAQSQPAKKMVFVCRGSIDLAIGRNDCTVADVDLVWYTGMARGATGVKRFGRWQNLPAPKVCEA